MNVIENSQIETIELDIGKGKRPPLIFIIVMAGVGVGAFFTGLTFVPGIGNNIGPFEVMALIMFGLTFIYFFKNRSKVKAHPMIRILLLIVVTAVISLPNLSDRLDFGLIQLLLLVYNFLLVLIFYNILLQFPSLLKYLLRFVALGAFIAGAWVMVEGIRSGVVVTGGGTFRNRVHIGIYLLTAFWLVMVYAFWPGISRWERIGAALAILVALYGVAISGRRSVYLSLFIGLGLLALSFILVRGKSRFGLPLTVGFIAGLLFFLAQIGSEYIPQLGFFDDRVGLIDDRLESVVASGDEIEDSDNFVLLQRQGMFRAIADHPFLGIGWGGFYNSEYSPTGHEMHSTPQRFLAELGIIGFLLYLFYNIYLWVGSVRLFLRLRNTKYQMSAFILMVAIWSLSISWAYNRSVTERTYWLLIILFISFETLVNNQLAKQKKPSIKNNTRQFGFYQRPNQRHSPPLMPLSRK